MRILQITSSMDDRGGGPPESIRRQIEARSALGIRTTLAAFDDAGHRASLDGISFVPLGRGYGKYRYNPGAASRIADLSRGHDIAIVNGLWQHHSLAAHAALVGRIPYVVYPHGMLDPWYNKAYPLRAIKKRLYWPWADFRTLRDAAAVCFTTDTERILARCSFRPYAAREVTVSYGTARPPQRSEAMLTAFHERCPQVGSRPFLLFLSRIHLQKGCDLLIDAFLAIARQHPELLLVMAGPDQDGWAAELSARTRSAGLEDRVLWPGMLRGDEKWGAFHAAEAFCLPSHHENFGIAVAEALACGLPVLISDQVNIWREIVEDQAGIVEADTPEGCLRCLDRWFALTPAQRLAMGRSAAACFDHRFDLARIASNQVKLLDAILSGRIPPVFRAG